MTGARAAYESLDDVDQLFQSGIHASFTLKPGQWFDERAIVEALEENKLGLGSFTRSRRPRAQSGWVVGVEPFT